MSDLISRNKVLGIIMPRLNSSKIGSLENQKLYSILKEVKEIPAAFDVDSVIAELEKNSQDIALICPTDQGYEHEYAKGIYNLVQRKSV